MDKTNNSEETPEATKADRIKLLTARVLKCYLFFSLEHIRQQPLATARQRNPALLPQFGRFPSGSGAHGTDWSAHWGEGGAGTLHPDPSDAEWSAESRYVEKSRIGVQKSLTFVDSLF